MVTPMPKPQHFFQPCLARNFATKLGAGLTKKKGNSLLLPEAPKLPSSFQKYRNSDKPRVIPLMIEILHYLKDPKPWELWHIPYHGS